MVLLLKNSCQRRPPLQTWFSSISATCKNMDFPGSFSYYLDFSFWALFDSHRFDFGPDLPNYSITEKRWIRCHSRRSKASEPGLTNSFATVPWSVCNTIRNINVLPVCYYILTVGGLNLCTTNNTAIFCKIVLKAWNLPWIRNCAKNIGSFVLEID